MQVYLNGVNQGNFGTTWEDLTVCVRMICETDLIVELDSGFTLEMLQEVHFLHI